jgi:AraC-like DNA-binding protein
MTLLLDTRSIVPEARRDAVHDAYLRADVPRQVSVTGQPAVDSTRIEAWMFGTVKLFCPESPGMVVVRTGPAERLDPMIALCVQVLGSGQSTEDGRPQHLVPGDLLMVGPTSPNEFLIKGATAAIEIPFDEIGVSVETARRASERLPSSPLFGLVRGHLLSLLRDADDISLSAESAAVGVATTQLVKALIVSAAEEERTARAPLGDALAPRIFAYVRQHLTDRDLTPATIARAHHISVRYLYKLCDRADVRPVEWVVAERLEGARRDLSAPVQDAAPISSIARKWGFKNPSHFSNRFRHAYGVSPRELQQHSLRQHRKAGS